MSNHGVLGTTVALAVGAKVVTGKTRTDYIRDLIADDVFIAEQVPSDAEMRALYGAYIMAMPLMLTKAAEPAPTEMSGEGTGTGSQQTIAHGLGRTPSVVIVGNVDDGANPYQSQGADAVNIYITAVDTKKYYWVAKL